MAALGDDDALRLERDRRLVEIARHVAAQLVVAREEAEVGLIPPEAGQRPGLAGCGEDPGRVADRARVELDLPGVERVHEVAVLAVNGDLDVRVLEFGLQLLLHPVEGFTVIGFADTHLVAGLPLIAADGEDALGHDAQLGENAPREPDQGGVVHTHRAVVGAAAAGAARPEDHVLQLVQLIDVLRRAGVDERRQHPARPVDAALEDAADLIGLVGRRHRRVVGAGERVVARLGAQAAVDAATERCRQRARQPFAHQLDQLLGVVDCRVEHLQAPPLERRRLVGDRLGLRRRFQRQAQHSLQIDRVVAHGSLRVLATTPRCPCMRPR